MNSVSVCKRQNPLWAGCLSICSFLVYDKATSQSSIKSAWLSSLSLVLQSMSALRAPSLVPRTPSFASALTKYVSAKTRKVTKLKSLQNECYQPYEAYVAQWNAMQGWCLAQLCPDTHHLRHRIDTQLASRTHTQTYKPSRWPKHMYLKDTLCLSTAQKDLNPFHRVTWISLWFITHQKIIRILYGSLCLFFPW